MSTSEPVADVDVPVLVIGGSLVGLASAMFLAQAAAEQISDQDKQAWVMAVLARTAMSAGNVDRAQLLAQAIPNLSWRARVLADLARAATGARDLNRAQKLVTST